MAKNSYIYIENDGQEATTAAVIKDCAPRGCDRSISLAIL